MFVPDESVKSTGCRNNDMRTSIFILDQVDIFLNRCAAVKHCCSNVGHVLAEPGVFIANLKRQFTGVTEDEDRDFAVDRLDLLESCKNKDCRLSEAGFRLT
jgi:hypothetical protein